MAMIRMPITERPDWKEKATEFASGGKSSE